MDLSTIELPSALVRSARALPSGHGWLDRWRDLARTALTEWGLTLDLPGGTLPWVGSAALVVPVRRADGSPAVLKITIPHEEALPEPDALVLWGGRGAVRLLAASRDDYVLLLQRLDGDRSLAGVPLDDTAAIWGGLVRELALTPDKGELWRDIPSVAAQAEMWTDTMPADWDLLGRPFDRWLLECALEVCQVRGAVGRRSEQDVLVHSDLHYLNILARLDSDAVEQAGYLAIDPKPVVGDAEFAVAPMLWNRIGDLFPGDPEGHLRERCSDLAFAAGLDPLLARDWAVVREVQNALSAVEAGNQDDAQRSLWVASTLLRRTLPELPAAADLARP
ncbi:MULTISPECIES: aminoglycoside phosphotransferase family protein [unclassified Arthrobacter]|uniref:aminoglycoside phosphotransferase family protein n=1 Tax=unclassified Arthrobacter TaxID=235627 RepID=UPI001492DF3B|nr:aminoglycoside phosphotransferase family protein [Arthrobacter sp. AET 35A]MBE0009278.1 aminoglycoside resistance protein [Arthrobacter sp. AET 35A]NOJ61754.1 aminoglycoside resistance protein [Arthrobacter sp. 260]NOJ63113.1 aminoglycoside resistance protein [Arthrobacter sp. 147(2020)]